MEAALGYLANLATIASLVLQAGGLLRRSDGSVDVEDAIGRARLTPAQMAVLQEPGSLVALQALIVIHPAVLDAITKKLKQANEEYAERLLNAKDQNERFAADAKAKKDICEFLNRLRDLNGGQLAGDTYESMWTSYGCVAY